MVKLDIPLSNFLVLSYYSLCLFRHPFTVHFPRAAEPPNGFTFTFFDLAEKLKKNVYG
jgi:hypothetical protein